MNKSKILSGLFFLFLAYIVAAWLVFQWRNPQRNQSSFYRDFIDVATLGGSATEQKKTYTEQKLDEIKKDSEGADE